MGLKTFLGGVHPFEGKELAENDIYTDILNTVKPEYPGLSRTDIKKHIMAWLFSTNTQRKHSNNQIIQAISEYFLTQTVTFAPTDFNVDAVSLPVFPYPKTAHSLE